MGACRADSCAPSRVSVWLFRAPVAQWRNVWRSCRLSGRDATLNRRALRTTVGLAELARGYALSIRGGYNIVNCSFEIFDARLKRAPLYRRLYGTVDCTVNLYDYVSYW